MIWRVLIEDSAFRDVESVRDWIAHDSPDAANRWVDGLILAVDSLERFPRGHPRALEQDVFEGEIRQMLYHSHRVIYKVDEPVVRILHVRHSAMRPLGWGKE